ncbi:MAG: efflux RND transporter periplasmic adaptor subunit [Acidobacteriia bacterium]|nr:efflux RND transporter periplasmic adaptor subunit [Terriglobia bacterium]
MTDAKKVLLLSLAGPFLWLAGCGPAEKPRAAAPETLRGVALIAVQAVPVSDVLEAVGTVQAAQSSTISSQISGTITQIRAQEGTRVKKGQVLAVLDDAQPRASLASAQAALAAAEQQAKLAEVDDQLAAATLRRYQTLYEKKSLSAQEFDEFKARREAAAARSEQAQAGAAQARAMLREAQIALEHSLLRAPFDGVVTAKRADAGTLAAPGTPLFVLEDTRGFRLEATVGETEIQLVRAGQKVPVVLDALGAAPLAGRVSEIVPAADPRSRTFTVKVTLPADARLHSGLFGRALIARGKRSAIVLPAAAIVERGQLQAVYVIGADGIAALRYVTAVAAGAEQKEVLSGLAEGERVAAHPGQQELAGKRIEVAR